MSDEYEFNNLELDSVTTKYIDLDPFVDLKFVSKQTDFFICFTMFPLKEVSTLVDSLRLDKRYDLVLTKHRGGQYCVSDLSRDIGKECVTISKTNARGKMRVSFVIPNRDGFVLKYCDELDIKLKEY